MAAKGKTSLLSILNTELAEILANPVEGFDLPSVVEENYTKWSIAMFGPPNTLYQGGYFKMELSFPDDYPLKPPTLRFVDPFWHPNVYQTGSVCLSILDTGDSLLPGQDPTMLWKPGMRARTILTSLLSIVSEPNTLSPANVDASGQYRRWKDHGDTAYPERVQHEVERSAEVAKREGVKVPVTVEEYVSRRPLTLSVQPSHTSDSDTDPLEDATPPSSP